MLARTLKRQWFLNHRVQTVECDFERMKLLEKTNLQKGIWNRDTSKSFKISQTEKITHYSKIYLAREMLMFSANLLLNSILVICTVQGCFKDYKLNLHGLGYKYWCESKTRWCIFNLSPPRWILHHLGLINLNNQLLPIEYLFIHFPPNRDNIHSKMLRFILIDTSINFNLFPSVIPSTQYEWASI